MHSQKYLPLPVFTAVSLENFTQLLFVHVRNLFDNSMPKSFGECPPLLFYFSQWLLVCMSCWGMFLSLEIWQNTVEFLQSPLQSTFFYCSSACDHFFQHYQHHPDHNHKCRLNPDLRHYHRS